MTCWISAVAVWGQQENSIPKHRERCASRMGLGVGSSSSRLVIVVGFSAGAHGAYISASSVANFSQFTALRVYFTESNSVSANCKESKQRSGEPVAKISRSIFIIAAAQHVKSKPLKASSLFKKKKGCTVMVETWDLVYKVKVAWCE